MSAGLDPGLLAQAAQARIAQQPGGIGIPGGERPPVPIGQLPGQVAFQPNGAGQHAQINPAIVPHFGASPTELLHGQTPRSFGSGEGHMMQEQTTTPTGRAPGTEFRPFMPPEQIQPGLTAVAGAPEPNNLIQLAALRRLQGLG